MLFRGVSDTTCATTGPFRVKGKDYSSLYDYYNYKHPHLSVDPNDSVAMVSFPGIDRLCPVVATRLHLRVMNDAVPPPLKQVDKISPAERRTLIEKLWSDIGNRPLGPGRPSVPQLFWRVQNQGLFLKPPKLNFAKGEHLYD